MADETKTYITRSAKPNDSYALQHLWKTVFGDSDGEIDAFFRCYFDPQMTVIVSDDRDIPMAAGYILPVGNLMCNETSIPCAMIYSVATHPDYRSLGFGKAVVDELIFKGFSKGFSAVVLCPSENDLFEYYSTRTQLTDWFYISECKVEAPQVPSAAVKLSPVTANDYYSLREELLSAVPHIELDTRALSYQLTLSSHFGGGLFRADAPGGAGCAVVEKQPNGEIRIKELIVTKICQNDVLSAIASIYPSDDFLIRSPALTLDESPGTRRFGMLASQDNDLMSGKLTKDFLPYYGLAFD